METIKYFINSCFADLFGFFFCFSQSADFKILPNSHGHARDAYAFGTMVENLLTVLNDQGEERHMFILLLPGFCSLFLACAN